MVSTSIQEKIFGFVFVRVVCICSSLSEEHYSRINLALKDNFIHSVIDRCLPLQVIWSSALGDPLAGLHAISL